MGPFSYEKQLERATAIENLLKSKKLSREAREMWTRILNSIAFTEDEYNARVMYFYRNFPQDRVISNV